MPGKFFDQFEIGEEVGALWKNGNYYGAFIVGVHADGTYDIDFDDGDYDERYCRRIPRANIM